MVAMHLFSILWVMSFLADKSTGYNVHIFDLGTSDQQRSPDFCFDP